MKVYNTSVRNYIDELLSLKTVKNMKGFELLEKLTNMSTLVKGSAEVATNKQEVDEFSLFEIIFLALDTRIPDIVIPTLEFFHKLVLFNYMQKILPLLTSEGNRTYSHIFVIKIHYFIKRKSLKENLYITVIEVLVSLLNMEPQYIPLSSFLAIFNILYDLYRLASSLANLSAIKAAFITCFMNNFQSFEEEKEICSELTLTKNAFENSEILDSKNAASFSNPSSHSKSESSSSIPYGIKTESNQSGSSFTKAQNEINFDLNNFEDIEENNLKIIFKDYKIDMNDNKLMRCFCIYERLCRGVITLKVENIPFISQMKVVKFSLKCIIRCLKMAGSKFKRYKCFKEVTRKYLFLAITQNYILNDKRLFIRSLNTFIHIVKIFSDSLKFQIQKYFNEIILKSFELNIKDSFKIHYIFNSLIKFCSDPELMSRLFINYDCDMVSLNIFERIINIICTFAKNPSSLCDLDSSLSPSMRKDLDHFIRKPCLGMLTNILIFLKTSMDSSLNDFKNAPEEIKTEKEYQENKKSLSIFKERKDLMLQAIEIFNNNPKEGIDFFIKNKFVDDDISSIAKFLRQEERLSPIKIGEILGHHEQKYIDIMHKYVEQMNLKDIDFLQALRQFLSEFRLPGEAQKIDRLMEKFASHFYESNKENCLFESPDSAYVFAYSIIMLTTDLHNPQVKRKITREQYIEINRNNDGESNISEEYILQVYESILKNEIKLKSKYLDDKSIIDLNCSNDRINEISQIKIMSLNPTISEFNTAYEEIEQSDIVISMFSTIWKQLLVCYGWILNETQNHRMTLECLQGIRICIRISSIYHMDLIRDSFINSLIPFTLLNTNTKYIHDIQKKNVSVVKTILLIAKEDGNYLRKSWKDVLVCISNMEIFQDIKTMGKSVISNESFDREEIYKSLSIIKGKPQDVKIRFIKIIDELSSQDLIVLVDQIFINSTTFDPEGLIQFVSALCKVSRSELFSCKPSRTFSLQKILEVVYYNINRPRIVSNNMWFILSPFLIEVSSLENEKISIFCIDSIRQLISKVLERKEIKNFHFQSDFLKPFEHMILQSKFQNVKEHGLRCIHQIISSYASNIGSGWKTIFSILANVLNEPEMQYEEIVFNSLFLIMDSHIKSTLEYIDQILDLIVIFCKNIELYDINLRTIKLLFNYYKKIELLDDFSKFFQPVNTNNKIAETQLKWNIALLNILYAFVRIIQEGATSVRTEALVLFFTIFKSSSIELSEEQWIDIFQILADIFEFINTKKYSEQYIKQWLDQMCSSIFAGFIELYTSYFQKLPLSVTQTLFTYLKKSVTLENDIFKSNLLFTIKFILKNLYKQFNDDIWNLVVDIMVYMIKTYTPIFFLEYKTENIYQNHDTNTGIDQNCELFDYGSYDKNVNFRVSDQINSDSESFKIIETQFNLCKQDIKVMETFNILIKIEEIDLEKVENLKKIIFLAPSENHLFVLCDEIRQHRKYFMEFNKNYKRMKDLVNYIGKSRPDLQMIWNGKIIPNMAIQETLATTCLIKLLHITCVKVRFSDKYFEYFSSDIKSILERYPHLYLQCVNKEICFNLLEFTLSFLIKSPKNYFGMLVKYIYADLIPLIKLSHNDKISLQVTLVFQKLTEFIGRIQLD